MLVVGVHLQNEFRVKAGYSVRNAALIGIAQTFFLSPEEVDTGIFLHQLGNDRGGAVRRVVINDQDVQLMRVDSLRLFEDPRKQLGKIGSFVVSRHNDTCYSFHRLDWCSVRGRSHGSQFPPLGWRSRSEVRDYMNGSKF